MGGGGGSSTDNCGRPFISMCFISMSNLSIVGTGIGRWSDIIPNGVKLALFSLVTLLTFGDGR